MAAITIDHVVKKFGDVRAVDEVSLQIKKGELFFMLGPSGCGKTTLLRMIAGFYFPDGGRILFDDRDVSLVPPHERNTGMVFQNYALWPHMKVWENLAFGLEMHKIPESERRDRVERALGMIQMAEYSERLPTQLSGGQQQRIALARALVLEPDVVLLDEPLSNLDAKMRLEMREQIKRLHEQFDMTMVYVTHDQSEALSMADRMAIMKQGRLSQLGTPRGIYHRPSSQFVADFIGETNLIQGRVKEINGYITVETAVGIITAGEAPKEVTVGDAVCCSIRPERLDVLHEGETRETTIESEVLQVFFLGNHEQYYLKLPDGTEVKSIEFQSDAPKAIPGATVRVGCDPEDVVVLRGEA